MRYVLCMSLLACMILGSSPADLQAASKFYPFQPTPTNLWDLDHTKYYTWGINWSVPAGETIIGASLFIDNINDWVVESGDILYIHLLDNPAVGVTVGTDNQGGGDAFSGQGILLTTYTDDDSFPNPAEDWTYNFTTPGQVNTLKSYVANGVLGLGLDPDCHYYNDGITLTIETAPEPVTAMLAVPALALLRRRRGLRLAQLPA
jgi:hypothetical protein